jgi:hypothetical protein
VSPILTHALHLAELIMFVWPLTLVAAVAIVCRRTIHRRLAFYIVGILVCYGASWIVGIASASAIGSFLGYPNTPEPRTAIFEVTFWVTCTSIAASAVPLFWLLRAFSSGGGKQTDK